MTWLAWLSPCRSHVKRSQGFLLADLSLVIAGMHVAQPLACPYTAALRLRNLDASGRLFNDAMLKDAGFTVGMTVKRKSDDVQGEIKSMSGSHVTLLVEGAEKTASSESFLNGDWKEVRCKPEAEEITDWMTFQPSCSEEFFLAALKGKVIHHLFTKCVDQPKDIEIYEKPKSVHASKNFPAKALKIPLSTFRVDIRPEEKCAAGAVCLGHCSKDWLRESNKYKKC